MKISQKQVDKIGTVASVMSIMMYVSYIPQIMANVSGGPKGNPIQPLVAFINCTVWTLYGFLQTKKDWPIIWANIPGIFLGLATFLTAIL